jgi:hypothetical protein
MARNGMEPREKIGLNCPSIAEFSADLVAIAPIER